MASQVALQWMNIPRNRKALWKIRRPFNYIENSETFPQLIGMSRLNAFLAFRFEECFSVPYAGN